MILGDVASGAYTLGCEAGAHTGQVDLVGVSVESDVTTCLGGTCIYCKDMFPYSVIVGALIQASLLSSPLCMAFLFHFTALGRQWVGCWASTCSGWCCFIAPWHPLNQVNIPSFLGEPAPTPVHILIPFLSKKEAGL